MTTTRHDLVDRDALNAMRNIVATSFVCDDCRKKKPIAELHEKSPRWFPRCIPCQEARIYHSRLKQRRHNSAWRARKKAARA